jgi:hypothetical protein
MFMLTRLHAGFRRTLIAAFAASLVALGQGCNDTQPPVDPAAAQLQPAKPAPKLPANRPEGDASVAVTRTQQVTPQGPANTAAIAQPVEPQPALPNIPADAQFTIFCYAVNGPSHVRDANGVKDALVRKTGRSDWYLIHGRDESNLYFGFYKAVQPSNNHKDDADVARAQVDLQMVKDLVDSSGKRPFEHNSAFISLESPDPTSPPEWNLFNVDRNLQPKDPKRAYWSLQIMAFRANPLRKEAAVQAVRDLREKGVEAYYYHGESVSSVCIGHWRPDAVKAQNKGAEKPDVVHGDPNTDLVFTNFDPGDDAKPRMLNGKPVVAAIAKLEIMDPSLDAMMKRFPHHAVNYEEGRELRNGKTVWNPSFLVEIPRAKGNGLYDSDPAPVQHADPGPYRRPDTIGNPNGPSMTSGGR